MNHVVCSKVGEEWKSTGAEVSAAVVNGQTMDCILHSPLFLSFYRCLSFFLMSPCLPLWHRFKPSHIIRESRASLLCLWGFPSLLYNDLPVGLLVLAVLPASLTRPMLWPDSSPNRTHFVLDSVFGTSCSCTTPAADSFVLLTAGFFFLHHLLFFFLFFYIFPVWSVFQALFLFFSVSLFVSFLLTFFPALASSAFFPPLSAEEAVSAVMYEGSWRPPASQQSVWRVFLSSTIGHWLFTRLCGWINTNCHTCRSPS